MLNLYIEDRRVKGSLQIYPITYTLLMEKIMDKSFKQILQESMLATQSQSQDVDVDLYYADTSLTEEELTQLRAAFEAKLAVNSNLL